MAGSRQSLIFLILVEDTVMKLLNLRGVSVFKDFYIRAATAAKAPPKTAPKTSESGGHFASSPIWLYLSRLRPSVRHSTLSPKRRCALRGPERWMQHSLALLRSLGEALRKFIDLRISGIW
jgi:hypothetical protein